MLYLENKYLYRRLRCHGPLSLDPVPLGQAKVVREGRDVTLITYSAGVHQAIEVADELDKDGISVEVIDIRTLVPLDIETIVASVEKTSRAVVLHEAARRMGYGAEIAAEVQERCFWYLDQPVVRIGCEEHADPDQPATGGRDDPAAGGDRGDPAQGGTSMSDFDIVVVGGGPGGYAAALYAASAGQKVAMVEKRDRGRHLLEPRLHPGEGAAARRGGVPHGRPCRRLRHQPSATVRALRPDWRGINKRKSGIVSKLHKGLSGLLKRRKVTVVDGLGTAHPVRRGVGRRSDARPARP